jgi:hypothetical protein
MVCRSSGQATDTAATILRRRQHGRSLLWRRERLGVISGASITVEGLKNNFIKGVTGVSPDVAIRNGHTWFPNFEAS